MVKRLVGVHTASSVFDEIECNAHGQKRSLSPKYLIGQEERLARIPSSSNRVIRSHLPTCTWGRREIYVYGRFNWSGKMFRMCT